VRCAATCLIACAVQQRPQACARTAFDNTMQQETATQQHTYTVQTQKYNVRGGVKHTEPVLRDARERTHSTTRGIQLNSVITSSRTQCVMKSVIWVHVLPVYVLSEQQGMGARFC
jgi:hypothetical protein